jgi:hypothetical protein
MEYILNESAYKTTNGFKINNIKVDINIPQITYDNKHTITKKFSSKIGLIFDKYDEYKYTLDNDITETIEYSNSIGRVINIILDTNDNNKHEFNLILKSLDDTECFSYIKIDTNLNNKNITINVINLLNNKTNSFIAYNTKVDNISRLMINHIDLGGYYCINNLYSEVYDDSLSRINTIYYGNNNVLDYNYHIKTIGKRGIANIITEGLLENHAYKQHKGIIDFIEGCTHSEGIEKENCVLLDDTSISRSCPMLMCHEEDVEGEHGVSTGKIDDDKLFYLMSRGLDELSAKKLIIQANFGSILKYIKSEEVKNMVYDYLDKIF